MNKWLLLLMLTICWLAAGAALFSPRDESVYGAVTKAGDAKRVVSLAPSLTEILFALGLEQEIVGVTDFCDYPPAAAEKPKVGGYWQPSIEAVISAKPDLVVTLEFPQQKDVAGRLFKIGYDCLTVKIDFIDELFDAIESISLATGRIASGSELTGSLRAGLDRLSVKMASEEKVKVLWVLSGPTLRVAGRDTFVNEMIELAGGENAIGKTVHKYPPIGSEQVIACAPDVVIIVTAMGGEPSAELRESTLRYWSKFTNVPAVANNRIYFVEPDTVCKLGPRLYQGVETIAKCLRPELFEN